MKTFYDWMMDKYLNAPDGPDGNVTYTAKELALDFKYAHETIGAVNLAECPKNGYTIDSVVDMYLDKDDNTLVNYLTHLIDNKASEEVLSVFIEKWVEYKKEAR